MSLNWVFSSWIRVLGFGGLGSICFGVKGLSGFTVDAWVRFE